MSTASYAIFGHPADFRVYNYSRITSAGTALVTTVIKSAGGILRSVTIGTTGAATGTVLFEDGTASGSTVIYSMPGTVASGTSMRFDANFTSGLTVVAASGSPDMCITWK